MKKILVIIPILLLCGIVSATPPPMGIVSNNATYLTISTYDRSNQVVHPCVIYSASGWNGYHYLMAMTPLPGWNDMYENPSMRYSNDGITWEQLAGQPDPIIATPTSGFNSDPNIELVGNTLYLFYRYTNISESAELWYNYTTTTDGVTWTTPVKLAMDKTRSSSFIYNGMGWESWGHNITTDNVTHFSSPGLPTFSESGITTINSIAPYYRQWHSEVKKYDGEYMLLMTDHYYTSPNPHLRFYTSSDGLTWNYENSNNPVLTGRTGYWDKILYKASFIEKNNRYQVWYGGITAIGDSGVVHVGYTQYPSLDGIASITITSPNVGETWQRGTPHMVTWDYTGSPGSTVKIVLLKAGQPLGTATYSTSIGLNGKGSYPWTISSGRAPGNDYQILVQSVSQPTIKDVSNGYFTITSGIRIPPPTITVTSPNGGEIWKRGTPHTITWKYTGSPGPYVKIELLQGGTPVGTATYSTSIGTSGTGSYPWAISSSRAPGTNYWIRVTSVSQPTISNTSNSDFTITA